MLIGLAVGGAALALAVGAGAALGATVAAGVVPGLLRPLTVIAVEERQRHKSRALGAQINFMYTGKLLHSLKLHNIIFCRGVNQKLHS